MSTTTSFGSGRLIRQTALAAWCSVVAMIVIPAVMLLATEDAEALLVVMPGEGLLDEMPAGAAILSWDKWSATISVGRTGTVHDIYTAGALLVLPIRPNSCLNLGRAMPLAQGQSTSASSVIAASRAPSSWPSSQAMAPAKPWAWANWIFSAMEQASS